MSGYTTIDEIKDDNPRWFSEDSMAFFRCLVYPDVWSLPNGDAVFVTSEQQGSDEFRSLVDMASGMMGLAPGEPIIAARKWTLRYATVGGGVSTIGHFGGYDSKAEAYRAARLFVHEHQPMPI